MIAFIETHWHRWILGHWQTGRMNGTTPPAVVCACGSVWEFE